MTSSQQLRIATRQSPLALWQAHFVKAQLMHLYPNLTIDLVKVTTQGDQYQSQALTELGGKSLFVKELQNVLLRNEADIAVHSIKDMSVHAHADLLLGAILKRADARDAFVSHQASTFNELKNNAVIGTASPRRQALIKHFFPQLQVQLLRGNVNTRLQKLDNGQYDAIILAAAGLERLALLSRVRAYLPCDLFIPAIGQGAIGIECCRTNDHMLRMIQPLHDHDTADCVAAERAVNRILGGNCFAPIGAHATVEQKILSLSAFVASVDGKVILRASQSGPRAQAEATGIVVAESLIAQGALTIMNELS